MTSTTFLQSQSPPQPPPLLLALAGPTSSGKTTLASALSLIFSSASTKSPAQETAAQQQQQQQQQQPNPLTIIHADDFYLPDSKIPTLPDGTQDWDCPEALDIPRFHSVLSAVQNGGEVPWNLVRQGGLEDGERGGSQPLAQDEQQILAKEPNDGVHAPSPQSSSSSPLIPPSTISRLRTRTLRWPPSARNRRIVVVEGIFLFSPPTPNNNNSALSTLTPLYNLKILLRTTHAAAKRRREKRNGYVTLEGFWTDPPGYFDRVVWPGFQRVYGGFFVGGDVEGQVVEEVGGVLVGPLSLVGDEGEKGEGEEEGGKELEGILVWVFDVLERELLAT